MSPKSRTRIKYLVASLLGLFAGVSAPPIAQDPPLWVPCESAGSESDER
jgi:hypothetical protein